MQNSSLLNQEKFWSVVKCLAQLKEKKSLVSLYRELDITETQLNIYLNFMREVGFQFQLKSLHLWPQTEEKVFSIQFNLMEWLQFQAHFPALSKCAKKPYHEDVKVKLMEIEDQYKEHDLFKPVESLQEVFNQYGPFTAGQGQSPTHQTLLFLEESIFEEKMISIQYNEKQFKILPLKIVYFEGGLNLIGENSIEGLLTNFRLKNIESCFDESSPYTLTYSKFEIERFISSLKAMHEKVIRLVLKIYSHEEFGIHLNQIYFHNPCLFTNSDGDYIWAASLEPSTAVFEWLCDMGQYVEILDPTSFKRDFLSYCEDKLKKIA